VIEPLVSHEWLAAHRDEVVLVDVRRDMGAVRGSDAYALGHTPGAVLVDLERWLAGPPTAQDGRHPLPDPEVFAEGMALAGIGDDDVVVAFDDSEGVVAARLVWMLRVTGRSAALLDGGSRLDDGPLEAGLPERSRATFTPRPWPQELLADLDEALAPAGVWLDARPAGRYAGAPDPLDPRPGHLPGARSLPCRDNVDAQGMLLPDDVLRARFAAIGVGPGTPVVSSCGSGVTACHTLLVMEHLGLPPGRLYPGSWSQYAADPDRPVELGPDRSAPAAGCGGSPGAPGAGSAAVAAGQD
jgi:thiosulfate/3-mercaptopyruvate sulfurtransferase